MTKPQQIEPVKIRTLSELKAAIKQYMPGSDSMMRSLLITGMKIAKHQLEIQRLAAEIPQEVFGQFTPALPADGDTYIWVDRMIHERLDGKRDGIKITWTVKEGRFVFDPDSGELISHEQS